MTKVLMKGNEAIAEAAIQAGCDAYFGYPITPQSEVLEYMAKKMPELGRVFVQGESEVASINMVFGAAAGGARVMTASSSPGISLKAEGLSYLAGAELPCVVVNIMRGGPGLGGIQPSQSDYFQATKGGGHGDYRLIVLAPASVQEAFDLTVLAFDLADKYRNPVMILADGAIGQVMEPLELREVKPQRPVKDWALTGAKGREKRTIKSLLLSPTALEKHNLHLQEKYARIRAQEVRYAEYMLDDARIVVVAFGTAGRIAQTAIRMARGKGISVGLLRPITLWPFPEERIAALAERVSSFLVVELNAGQMVEDVKLAVEGKAPVHFYGRMGGMMPMPEEILEEIVALAPQVEPELVPA
ncbi:MAG: 3-methyl-2-oxobutanoate dehydrogenase subunit VorB [Anaerolineae bacterium]